MNTDNDNNRASEPAASGGESSPSASGEAPAVAAAAVDPIVAERDHLKEQLLRTAADFDNFRKRAQRELDDARQRGKDDLIRELCRCSTTSSARCRAASAPATSNSVLEGVRMVLKLFEDTAERVGLTRVPTVGQRFDPAVHEAMQQTGDRRRIRPAPSSPRSHPATASASAWCAPAMVVVARKPSARNRPQTRTTHDLDAPRFAPR